MRGVALWIPVERAPLPESQIARDVERRHGVAEWVADGRGDRWSHVAVAEPHDVGDETEVDDADRSGEPVDLPRRHDRRVDRLPTLDLAARGQRSGGHEVRIRELPLHLG